MTPREELTALAAAQRDSSAAALRARAASEEAVPREKLLEELSTVFCEGDPGFDQAARAASRILQNCDARLVDRVTLRPNGYNVGRTGVTVSVKFNGSGLLRTGTEVNTDWQEVEEAWAASAPPGGNVFEQFHEVLSDFFGAERP